LASIITWRAHEEVLRDPLTGVSTGVLIEDRVRGAVARRRHRRGYTAVLFCDLNDFKRINDTLGHATGDRLLHVTAQRLCAAVRPQDLVGAAMAATSS
jgi:diguanylate cyclase (GGDEF)-like protein